MSNKVSKDNKQKILAAKLKENLMRRKRQSKDRQIKKTEKLLKP